MELIDVHKKSPEVCKFIFADTPYENVGKDTILQMFLSAYVCFSDTYVYTKYTFLNSFAEEEVSEDNVLFFALFLLFTKLYFLYYLLFLNRYSRAIPCFAKRHLIVQLYLLCKCRHL